MNTGLETTYSTAPNTGYSKKRYSLMTLEGEIEKSDEDINKIENIKKKSSEKNLFRNTL
jgi:hypothetical protein